MGSSQPVSCEIVQFCQSSWHVRCPLVSVVSCTWSCQWRDETYTGSWSQWKPLSADFQSVGMMFTPFHEPSQEALMPKTD